MRPLASTVCLILAVAFGHTAAWRLAAAEPDQGSPQGNSEIRVARLVRQLGSTSFQDRTSAYQELERIGEAGGPTLEQALSDRDPEIRLRAGQLLQEIKRAQVWTASEYRGRHEQRPASELLTRLGADTQNRLQLGDDRGVFHDARIDLEATGESDAFWPLVDRICRSSGNVLDFSRDESPRLIFRAGVTGAAPVAYSGPVRTLITDAQRKFSERFDYEQSTSEVSHTLQFNLRTVWEDRLHLVAYQAQPSLVEAVADTGESLSAARAGDSRWNIVGRGLRMLPGNVVIEPPPATARRLKRLVLSWRMFAVGEFEWLEMDLPATAPYRQGGNQVTIDRVEKHDGLWEVALVVSRDLARPEPKEVLFAENQCELRDAQRRPFVLCDQTGSPTDDGVRLLLRFSPPAPDSEPQTLRFGYPTLRSQRDLAIIFRDLPLPSVPPK